MRDAADGADVIGQASQQTAQRTRVALNLERPAAHAKHRTR
jgi:hypothetical protein